MSILQTIVFLVFPLMLGILLGYLFRKNKIPKLDKASVAVILVLIFSLGFGIGSNNQLLTAIPQVTLQGLLIAILAISFSIAFVIMGRRLVSKR